MSRVGKWPSLHEEPPSSHQQWRTLEAGGSALTEEHGVGSLIPPVFDVRTKSGIYLEFNTLRECFPWTRELSVLISQQVLSPTRIKKKNLKKILLEKERGEKREQGQTEKRLFFYCPFCLLFICSVLCRGVASRPPDGSVNTNAPPQSISLTCALLLNQLARGWCKQFSLQSPSCKTFGLSLRSCISNGKRRGV